MNPISPELVLVDPELARLARAQLPDPVESNGRKSNGRVTPAHAEVIAGAGARGPIVGAGTVARSTPPAVRLPLVQLREAVVAELDTEVEPRQPGRKLVLVAAGLCVFLLGVFIPQVLNGDDPGPSVQPRASEDEQPASATPRPASSAGSSLAKPPRTSEIGIGQAAQHAGPASVKRGARPSRSTAPPPSPQARREDGARKATDGGVPTRLFVWLPRRGASYYNVRFLKGMRTVFEAWPTDARVTVPMRGTFRGRSFAFTNGRFRWIVRPAFGPRSSARYGAPIVRSVWTVRP